MKELRCDNVRKRRVSKTDDVTGEKYQKNLPGVKTNPSRLEMLG